MAASVNTKVRENPSILAVLPPNLPAGARVRLLKAAGGLPAGAVVQVLAPKAATKNDVIGKIEPKTDRLVLQQPKSAEKIQELATDEHKAVKSALEAALKGIDGAKLYADRDEKDPERVAEKVDEGQSPRTMRDYSGFRIAVETPEAWKRTAAALRANFEVPDEQDEFEKGSAVNFHGHTAQVRVPGSKVTHEVQILPREVAENADADHPLYEKARDGDKAAERELMDRNRAHYIDFLDRNGLAKYKFGSTQADIDPASEAGKALETARAKIKDADLAGDGKDVGGGNHVTVRYGVKSGSDPEKLRKFLRAQAPFDVTLGATDAFPVSEHSEGAAPIIAPVESPELRRLHEEIAKHGDFQASDFAEYRPHATVAYVKPEAAKKYTGMPETKGKRFRVDAVSLSFRDGTQDHVQLAGGSASSELRSAPSTKSNSHDETTRKGGRGESSEPLSGAAHVAALGNERSPKTVMGEKLRAALAAKDSATSAGKTLPPAKEFHAPEKIHASRFVVPDGRGGFERGEVESSGRVMVNGVQRPAPPVGTIPIRVSEAMLQPVTGTPEEARQLALVGEDFAGWVADYLVRNTADGTTTIATDAAKTMLPAFAADPLKNDREVCAAAAAIRDGALNSLLNVPPEPSRPLVLLAVGSPGSGKTTSLALGGGRPGVGIKIEAIPDDAAKFKKLLGTILASGRKPVVEWVWAGTPKTTAARMILRAAGEAGRRGIGRVVETGYMAKAWTALPKVLDQVRKELGPKVMWLVADNSGPPGTAKVTSDVGTWLKRGERMQEDSARAQMDAELETLDRRGKLKGDEAQAALKAARAAVPGMPRTEVVEVAEPKPDLKAKMRAMAEARQSGDLLAKVRAGEDAAWKLAGERLQEPMTQVPF